MKDSTAKKIDELLERYPALEPCRESLYAAVDKICESFRGGGKLMTCGNGGSAADAQHIVGETALITAFSNDKAPDLIFAQQVFGLGKRGDVLLAISTSGNSDNVVYAVEVAKILGVTTISLTGRRGGKLKHISNVTICAPSDETFKIQEYHLPIYHALCIAAENEFFSR